RKNVEDFTGPRERSDLGFVTFDITADILCGKNGLQAIFDWNVKQLFLYLSAEYSTKNNGRNFTFMNPNLICAQQCGREVTCALFTYSSGLGNRNVTLTLSWNVVPNAGILPLVTGSGHVSVPFPDTYETTKSY
ncbi:SPCS3 peptidase, partial [Oreotrochilus melanogaster]|nr:SPCS3 peptidase [Oreotrochilus melanogaster]